MVMKHEQREQLAVSCVDHLPCEAARNSANDGDSPSLFAASDHVTSSQLMVISSILEWIKQLVPARQWENVARHSVMYYEASGLASDNEQLIGQRWSVVSTRAWRQWQLTTHRSVQFTRRLQLSITAYQAHTHAALCNQLFPYRLAFSVLFLVSIFSIKCRRSQWQSFSPLDTCSNQ